MLSDALESQQVGPATSPRSPLHHLPTRPSGKKQPAQPAVDRMCDSRQPGPQEARLENVLACFCRPEFVQLIYFIGEEL